MTDPVTLVAVIGPVEPALLAAWCAHYQQLGVERFAIALHCPDFTGIPARNELAALLRDVTSTAPLLQVTGPWHEHTNGELRDELRVHAGPGWHLLADSDEFQQHPDGLAASVKAAHAARQGVLGGLMLDRVAADGGFPAVTTDTDLDSAYPLGGLLTHRLLRGDPRKIVLAYSTVDVASGNHRAPGHRPDPTLVVPVHHFKWRQGIESALRARVENFRSGQWTETTPAVRLEAERLLIHLAEHHGHLDVTGAEVPFRPVTLTAVPPWWQDEARAVVEGWRPPHTRR